MSKLDQPVTIHFREDGIPGQRRGELTDESKEQIKALFLELIGEDEDLAPLGPLPNIQRTAFGKNIEKSTLRKKVEEL